MPTRRSAVLALAAAALTGRARAQCRFPERPITLVVPFAPGGIADLTARAVAEHMAKSLGQAVVVENKPSAGSIVASQAVATAKPDGHTLLLMSNGNAVSVGLFKKLPYDTLRDFAPITTLGFFDIGVFVAAPSKFATLRDLVAFAKANPGKLNVGSIAPGSTQHLSAKLFETVAGMDALVVPYKGSPAVLTALRAGEIDVAFEIVGPMLAQVAAGVVKALAGGRRAQPGLARRAHRAAGRRAGLRRRLVERARRARRNAGRCDRETRPRRARRGDCSGRARPSGRAGHAPAGQHAARAAGLVDGRDQALGRRDPRGTHRTRVGEVLRC